MRRVTTGPGLATCLAIAAFLAFAACSEPDPVEPSTDLTGLWLLPYSQTPVIFGLVSAQVIFRDDATFLFVGHNPLSSGPYGEFTVTGTWTRTESTVTLVTGDAAQTWNLDFRSDGVHFTHPDTGDTFRLFRPLPD